MSYKYLLFDADNTLFDFDKAERKAFYALANIFQGKFDEYGYEIYHKINQSLWREFEYGSITKDELKKERFRRYCASMGNLYNEGIIEQISFTFPKLLSKSSDLLPDAKNVLENLSPSYEIYIITNGTSEVQKERLANSEIYRFIKKMFISEEIGYTKPDIRFFDYVLNEIGNHRVSDYLVIGDGLTSDIDGAISSGIDCCYYNPEQKDHNGRKINYDVESLSKLKEFL